MHHKILVTYASKYGATCDIAQKIGETLQELELSVDIRPVDEVGDITPYETVVLGSAVYFGQWRKAAGKFLKTHETLLAKRQVWLFSSGPTGTGNTTELMDGWQFPKNLQAVADRIQPRDITVFHGVLDPKRLNIIESWITKNVKASIGDFRDWEGVKDWATQIAKAQSSTKQTELTLDIIAK